LQLEINQGVLRSVSYHTIDDKLTSQLTVIEEVSSDEDKNIILQFNQYFINPNIAWRINLNYSKTTAFQQSVLQSLRAIPFGTTKTYGQIAKELQTSARAVGNACRRNPFPIIVPCHRVVAQNGLGGYDGDKSNQTDSIEGRLAIKYFLLQHESAI